MMLLAHPALALALAALFGVVLVGALGWRHPRRSGAGVSLVFILLLMFPLLWAGLMWSVPAGPRLLGAAVVPPLMIGLTVAIIATVLNGPRPSPAREGAEADTAATVFGVLFWILMLLAAGMIVAGYLLD